jgi:hypothetical protein
MGYLARARAFPQPFRMMKSLNSHIKTRKNFGLTVVISKKTFHTAFTKYHNNLSLTAIMG